MKRVLFFLLLTFVLSSCDDFFDQVVDVDVPALPTRTVANGQMILDSANSTQSSIYIEVSKSLDPLSNAYPLTQKGASVQLFENGAFVEKLQLGWNYPDQSGDTLFFYSSSNFKPVPARTYRIEIDQPGLPLAYSEFTMPSRPTFFDARWIDRTEGKVEVSLRTDLSDAYFLLEVVNQNGFTVYYSTLDPSLEMLGTYEDIEGQSSGRAAVINNRLFGGSTAKFTIDLDSWNSPVTVRMASITRDTYIYLKSEDALDSSGDSPFAQPINLHVNVVNGLGFIGGLNFDQVDLP